MGAGRTLFALEKWFLGRRCCIIFPLKIQFIFPIDYRLEIALMICDTKRIVPNLILLLV